jgi:uncharacterized membrane protein
MIMAVIYHALWHDAFFSPVAHRIKLGLLTTVDRWSADCVDQHALADNCWMMSTI